MNRVRSKAVAAWLALLLGGVGAHRFYLRGARDPWAWLHAVPTLIGLYGVQRMRALGQDDQLAWVLIPLLGVVLSITMLMAIVYALTPDEKWDARWNEGREVSRSGWPAVFGAIAGLAVGATVLMSTIAFVGQRIFESLAQ
jgi:TM2 domain-containing membrane protein YozV